MTDPIDILSCVWFSFFFLPFFFTSSEIWASCPGLCAQCAVDIIATVMGVGGRGLDAMMVMERQYRRASAGPGAKI